MSDLGSTHYRSSAELAKGLNQCIITMKKQFYGLTIPKKQMATCRQYLANVLNTLLVEFTSGPEEDSLTVKQPIPASILKRVHQEHKGTLADYIKDVRAAKNRLLQDNIKLSKRDIQLLDDLAAIASQDTSEMFREMWRTR